MNSNDYESEMFERIIQIDNGLPERCECVFHFILFLSEDFRHFIRLAGELLCG